MTRNKVWSVFLISAAIYLALLPNRLYSLRPLVVDAPVPTGDEPYYLEMAHSLIYDHTLELTKEHYIDQSFRRFYIEDLPPHWSETTRAGHFSKHGPGLAVLAAPWYWVGDQFNLGPVTGSRALVAGLIAVLAALLSTNIYLLAFETIPSRRVATLVWLSMGLTSPIMSYSFLIFPAVPAGLAVAYAYRRIRAETNTWWQLGLAALAIAFLPWLHSLLLTLSAPLAIFLCWRYVRRPLALACIVPPLLVSGALFLFYYYYLYGTPLPNSQDHAGWTDFAGTLSGFVGSLVDQQWGLLIYSPFYVLALPGLFYMLRRNLPDFYRLAATSLIYCLVIFAYRQWWGEWGPPARYLVPVLPLLASPLAYTLSTLRRRAARYLFGVLFGISLVFMALFVAVPRLMYNHPLGQAELFLRVGDWVGGADFTAWLPAIVAPNQHTPVLTAVWLLIFLILAAAAWRLGDRDATGLSNSRPSIQQTDRLR